MPTNPATPSAVPFVARLLAAVEQGDELAVRAVIQDADAAGLNPTQLLIYVVTALAGELASAGMDVEAGAQGLLRQLAEDESGAWS